MARYPLLYLAGRSFLHHRASPIASGDKPTRRRAIILDLAHNAKIGETALPAFAHMYDSALCAYGGRFWLVEAAYGSRIQREWR